MNRLSSRTKKISSTSTSTAANYAVELARLSRSDDPLPHLLFAPLHYEAGYAYPLIIWLHGPGDDEQQLKRIMPLVSMRNYVSIAPRGTHAVCSADELEGFTWRQTSDDIALAEQRVFESLEIAQQRYHIAPRRVFIAGLQSGGTMAYRVALNHPEAFAGALNLGGRFPQGGRPLRRLNDVRQLPLFLATGLQATLYPQADVCRDLRLFHAAGLSVSVRQYPCEDELTTLMLSDMNRWIMQLVCGEQPASVQ